MRKKGTQAQRIEWAWLNVGSIKENSQHMKESTVDDIIEVASWAHSGHSGLETSESKAQRSYPGSFTMRVAVVRHVSCFVLVPWLTCCHVSIMTVACCSVMLVKSMRDDTWRSVFFFSFNDKVKIKPPSSILYYTSMVKKWLLVHSRVCFSVSYRQRITSCRDRGCWLVDLKAIFGPEGTWIKGRQISHVKGVPWVLCGVVQ